MLVPRDRVTVVIPTLNEGEAIGALLDELLGLGFRRDRRNVPLLHRFGN